MEELGQALVESLRLDKNGATLAVVPDLPLLDVPNGTAILMRAYFVAGTLMARCGFEPAVLGLGTVAAVTAVLALAAFCLFRWMVGMLLCG